MQCRSDQRRKSQKIKVTLERCLNELMDGPITVQLNEQEARLLFNTIQARSRYRPIKHPYGRVVWQPWMGVLLRKLSKALAEEGVVDAA
jgi:hypothetical protein